MPPAKANPENQELHKNTLLLGWFGPLWGRVIANESKAQMKIPSLHKTDCTIFTVCGLIRPLEGSQVKRPEYKEMFVKIGRAKKKAVWVKMTFNDLNKRDHLHIDVALDSAKYLVTNETNPTNRLDDFDLYIRSFEEFHVAVLTNARFIINPKKVPSGSLIQSLSVPTQHG